MAAADEAERLKTDEAFMAEAVREARRAAEFGEVPVGAVVAVGGRIVARGRNLMITANDPTAHAELSAIRAAARILGNYRLTDATLYSTLEPCVMCAGAIVHARVARVVYGAADAKTGADVSVFGLLRDPRHNHRPEVAGGVLAETCGALLSEFFARRRAEKRAEKGEKSAPPGADDADLPA